MPFRAGFRRSLIFIRPIFHVVVYWENMAEEARFKTSPVPETISTDLTSSFQSQSLAEQSEARDEPIKPDQTG